MWWWAVDRFYRLSRASSNRHALVPYCIGAGIGAAYAASVLGSEMPSIARLPLGAAIYLANPERTAPPPKRLAILPCVWLPEALKKAPRWRSSRSGRRMAGLPSRAAPVVWHPSRSRIIACHLPS